MTYRFHKRLRRFRSWNEKTLSWDAGGESFVCRPSVSAADVLDRP